MTGKPDGRPKFEFELEGKWIRPDWSGLATMTATALETAPGPPGLLVDMKTWAPGRAKLEWFALLKKIVEVHLRDNYWTTEKPCTIDIVNALRVEECLTEILTLGYVTNDHRQFLPMGITAIARTASAANALKAKGSRRRGNELKDAKLAAMARNPGLTWKALLRKLEGDRELIVSTKDDADIVWRDNAGEIHTTTIGTFQNWKKKPKS